MRSANDSAHFLFRCMGVGWVILCIRVPIITGLNVSAVRSAWYTFVFMFGIMPEVGLACMITMDFYIYTKERYMINFFDYLHEKITNGASVMLGGILGGGLTAVFLFDGTWAGAIKSFVGFISSCALVAVGVVCKSVFEKNLKPKIERYIKIKFHGKQKRRRRNRAA